MGISTIVEASSLYYINVQVIIALSESRLRLFKGDAEDEGPEAQEIVVPPKYIYIYWPLSAFSPKNMLLMTRLNDLGLLLRWYMIARFLYPEPLSEVDEEEELSLLELEEVELEEAVELVLRRSLHVPDPELPDPLPEFPEPLPELVLLVLVELEPDGDDPVINEAIFGPGNVYVAPSLNTLGSNMPGSVSLYAPGSLTRSL